jgi:2-methylcitrate dehydratase
VTIVEQLSAYTAGLRYEELPSDVVRQAKRLIVDTLGCALGGAASEPAKIARDIAGTVTGVPPATVMVSGRGTSPELAAFANGVMIRFLDFNDGYTSTGESGHPSDSIAAVLAAAEMAGRGGKDVIIPTGSWNAASSAFRSGCTPRPWCRRRWRCGTKCAVRMKSQKCISAPAARLCG